MQQGGSGHFYPFNFLYPSYFLNTFPRPFRCSMFVRSLQMFIIIMSMFEASCRALLIFNWRLKMWFLPSKCPSQYKTSRASCCLGRTFSAWLVGVSVWMPNTLAWSEIWRRGIWSRRLSKWPNSYRHLAQMTRETTSWFIDIFVARFRDFWTMVIMAFASEERKMAVVALQR